ncbi:MAG: DUF2267 domain-containing protein [Chloroflexi bacterium]|nr:DUF2267 domain-containing protein [Chloroflexota bacterium]
MQFHEFVGHVQNRAKLPSEGAAVHAIHSTLETLADRLTSEQVDHLAAQLPREIGEYLQRSDKTESFTLEEFFERVAEREDEDLPESVYHARVVMSVMREALTPGEWDHLQQQLPQDYQSLLEAGHEGSLQ